MINFFKLIFANIFNCNFSLSIWMIRAKSEMIYHHAITPSADNFSRSIFWRLYRFHHRSVSLFRKRRYLSKQSKVSGATISLSIFLLGKIFSELSFKIGLIFLQPLTMQTARIPTPPFRISTITSPTWNLMTRICCNKNIRKMTTVSSQNHWV